MSTVYTVRDDPLLSVIVLPFFFLLLQLFLSHRGFSVLSDRPVKKKQGERERERDWGWKKGMTETR